MTSPQAEYDRYLIAVPCDLCDTTAVWTVRYRFAGESARDLHTCARHRKQIEARGRRARQDGTQPIEFARIGRFAF